MALNLNIKIATMVD